MVVREKQREMRFAILENGEWKSGGIVKFGIFETVYVQQHSSGDDARQWAATMEVWKREQRQRENFDFQKKGKCCFDGGL